MAGSGAGPENSSLPWGAVALLATVQFSAFVDRALPSVVAPFLRSDVGLGDAEIGALQGPGFVVLYVIGLLLAGNWISGSRPWRVAALCIVAWTAGAVVFALATTWEGLLAGRMLLGAGQAAFAPAALLLLGGQTDRARRSRSLSLFTTGSATGRSGALLLGGLLLAALGAWPIMALPAWRLVCVVIVLPNLLLVGLLVLAGWSSAPRKRGPRRGLKAALGAVGARPATFIGLAVAGAGAVLVVQAIGAWAPSVFHRMFGLSPAESALLFGVAVLIAAPAGHLGAGWIVSTRHGRGVGPGGVMALAMAFAAASVACLVAASGGIAVILAILGLTASSGLAAATALITLHNLTASPLRPAMGALFLSVTSIVGVALGPWVTGLISDGLSRDGAALASALALTVIPASGLVGLVAAACNRLWKREADGPVTTNLPSSAQPD